MNTKMTTEQPRWNCCACEKRIGPDESSRVLWRGEGGRICDPCFDEFSRWLAEKPKKDRRYIAIDTTATEQA